jgi:hypothetical protein
MSITHLSTELLQKIYEYAELKDVIHLSQTSRRNYRVFLGRRMYLLEQGLHNSYSPLPALLQLAISNEPDKSRKPIGTEIRINTTLERITQVGDKPKLTLELMKKMVHYGKTAERWVELYPRLRWRFDSDNRRLLRQHEQERLRAAIYHHWTYTTLFHSRTFTQYSPDPPSAAVRDDPRHRLLRTYSTVDHIQLSEFLAHIEQLVELDLYPSNSVVREQYMPAFLAPATLEKMAWGSGNEYRRLVRDIMKLSPADLLHLVENTSTKAERLDFLCAKEACFGDVPATLNYALSTVSLERARYCWGLDDRVLKRIIPYVSFPSLRHTMPKTDVDLVDDSLIFGVVDVACREEIRHLGSGIATDGVRTGEYEKYFEQFGDSTTHQVHSTVVDETDEDT